MILYLVRHGEAQSGGDDSARSLTGQGEEAVKQMGEWVFLNGVRPTQIRHSGLRRAEQTARILAEHLKPGDGVVGITGLSPNDDVRPLVNIVAQEEQPLMFVGHLPFMGRLVSQLLVDDSEKKLVMFQAASMACLLRDGDLWTLKWLSAWGQIREINPG